MTLGTILQVLKHISARRTCTRAVLRSDTGGFPINPHFCRCNLSIKRWLTQNGSLDYKHFRTGTVIFMQRPITMSFWSRPGAPMDYSNTNNKVIVCANAGFHMHDTILCYWASWKDVMNRRGPDFNFTSTSVNPLHHSKLLSMVGPLRPGFSP